MYNHIRKEIWECVHDLTDLNIRDFLQGKLIGIADTLMYIDPELSWLCRDTVVASIEKEILHERI